MQGLHVAAEVVLLVVGAALVGPLEDDEFAAVLGERVLGAGGVGALEVGCRGAGGDGQRGQAAQDESKSEGWKLCAGHGDLLNCCWLYFATGKERGARLADEG